ncbi:MAG: uL15 family ribosomal protein [Clostridia bacterium]|nr:uL15 family ribosomal protein [Clostridia bacterium]
MSVVIIIFIIIASVFALASLSYVTVDVILEIRAKRKTEEETVVEQLVEEVPEEPEMEEEEPESMPETVDHISAEEADAMISDSLALGSVIYESGAGHGKQGIVNIGDINDAFDAGAVVTVSDLKNKNLIPKATGRVKILAHGLLEKPITVKAESYSVQAIKMIELTGGKVVILKN